MLLSDEEIPHERFRFEHLKKENKNISDGFRIFALIIEFSQFRKILIFEMNSAPNYCSVGKCHKRKHDLNAEAFDLLGEKDYFVDLFEILFRNALDFIIVL